MTLPVRVVHRNLRDGLNEAVQSATKQMARELDRLDSTQVNLNLPKEKQRLQTRRQSRRPEYRSSTRDDIYALADYCSRLDSTQCILRQK